MTRFARTSKTFRPASRGTASTSSCRPTAAARRSFWNSKEYASRGEFYLNGKFIGRHENGITAFGFDITDLLVPGENVIAARIDNSWDYKEKATGSAFQWNDKNFNANYGGINKNVWLHVTDQLYQTLPLYSNLETTGVYVYATDIDIKNRSAKITAETEVRNEHSTARTFAYEVDDRGPERQDRQNDRRRQIHPRTRTRRRSSRPAKSSQT